MELKNAAACTGNVYAFSKIGPHYTEKTKKEDKCTNFSAVTNNSKVYGTRYGVLSDALDDCSSDEEELRSHMITFLQKKSIKGRKFKNSTIKRIDKAKISRVSWLINSISKCYKKNGKKTERQENKRKWFDGGFSRNNLQW